MKILDRLFGKHNQSSKEDVYKKGYDKGRSDALGEQKECYHKWKHVIKGQTIHKYCQKCKLLIDTGI